jgi:dynein heavy chain
LIKSEPLKEFLFQKAKSIKEGFLKKVSEIVIESIQLINDRFGQIEVALKHVPETEQELIQLQNDIKNCDENLDKLEIDIEMTYKYMLLMEQHGHKFPANQMYKFWLLKISPLEIKRIFGDSQRTLI